jgi:hypothetical protein
MSRAGLSKAQNLVLPQFLRADKDARHTMDELECSLVTALPSLAPTAVENCIRFAAPAMTQN